MSLVLLWLEPHKAVMGVFKVASLISSTKRRQQTTLSDKETVRMRLVNIPGTGDKATTAVF